MTIKGGRETLYMHPPTHFDSRPRNPHKVARLSETYLEPLICKRHPVKDYANIYISSDINSLWQIDSFKSGLLDSDPSLR